jgi:hypothetical protein
MAEARCPDPAMLIVGCFSRYGQLLRWAQEQLSAVFGRPCLESPLFPFVETDYYAAQMGTDLKFQLLAFERLIQPEWLPRIKLYTNELEESCKTIWRSLVEAESPPVGVIRPLNLDPGYLHPGKWVLASTKDHAHRVYVGEGIYAEVTLYFRGKEWHPWPWTYPNYRRPDYREFFRQARHVYLGLRRAWRQGQPCLWERCPV